MNDRDWFKVWPKAALISDDLDELSDHEERVWWRLLMVASLEDARWTAPVNSRLALKCKSTPSKLAKALNKFVELGMVRIEGGLAVIVNAHQYNEGSNKKRSPSDAPEAVRERVARHRNERRNEAPETAPDVTGVTTPVTTHVTTRYENDVTSSVTTPTRAREEEQEEEEEEDQDPTPNGVGAPVALPTRPKALRPPRERSITEDDIRECQDENPAVDVRAVAIDYLNWRGSAGHRDKVQGLRNQLKSETVRAKFAIGGRNGTADGRGPGGNARTGGRGRPNDDPYSLASLRARGQLIEDPELPGGAPESAGAGLRPERAGTGGLV